VRHPAKFSDKIIEAVDAYLAPLRPLTILDPMAGVGRVHELTGHVTIGVEIEPEWAEQHPKTVVGDVLDLPWADGHFEAIVTSPPFGNRMADQYAGDGTPRHTYRIYLGRPLSEGNGATFQWGRQYRRFHRQAWAEADRVLKSGGLFLLNISDHIRAGRVMPVSRWHVRVFERMGYLVEDELRIETPRQRHGANREARVDYESVFVLRKP
jgi:tRNA G10  N-methylase Trm11